MLAHQKRVLNYTGEDNRRLTAKQRRRIRHKLNRAEAQHEKVVDRMIEEFDGVREDPWPEG